MKSGDNKDGADCTATDESCGGKIYPDDKIENDSESKIEKRDSVTSMSAIGDATGEIATGKVTTGEIAAGKVTTGEIAAGKVTTGEIAAGKVTAGEVTTGKVTTGEIAAGKVTTGKVTTGEIAAGKVTTGKVTTGEVTTGEIAAGKVTTGKVTTGEIAAGKVTTGKVTTGEVTTGEIAAGKVTTGEIAAGKVTTGEVTTGKVTTGEIAAGEVTTGEEAAGKVTTGEIAAGEIAAGKVPTGEVTTGEVTTGDIAAGKVTTGEIAAGKVTTGEVAAGKVTTGEVTTGEGFTGEVTTGEVTTGEVAGEVAGEVTIEDAAGDSTIIDVIGYSAMEDTMSDSISEVTIVGSTIEDSTGDLISEAATSNSTIKAAACGSTTEDSMSVSTVEETAVGSTSSTTELTISSTSDDVTTSGLGSEDSTIDSTTEDSLSISTVEEVTVGISSEDVTGHSAIEVIIIDSTVKNTTVASDVEDTTGGSDVEDTTGGSDVEDTTGGSDVEDTTGGSDVEDITGGSDVEDITGGSDVEDTTNGSTVEETAVSSTVEDTAVGSTIEDTTNGSTVEETAVGPTSSITELTISSTSDDVTTSGLGSEDSTIDSTTEDVTGESICGSAIAYLASDDFIADSTGEGVDKFSIPSGGLQQKKGLCEMINENTSSAQSILMNPSISDKDFPNLLQTKVSFPFLHPEPPTSTKTLDCSAPLTSMSFSLSNSPIISKSLSSASNKTDCLNQSTIKQSEEKSGNKDLDLFGLSLTSDFTYFPPNKNYAATLGPKTFSKGFLPLQTELDFLASPTIPTSSKTICPSPSEEMPMPTRNSYFSSNLRQINFVYASKDLPFPRYNKNKPEIADMVDELKEDMRRFDEESNKEDFKDEELDLYLKSKFDELRDIEKVLFENVEEVSDQSKSDENKGNTEERSKVGSTEVGESNKSKLTTCYNEVGDDVSSALNIVDEMKKTESDILNNNKPFIKTVLRPLNEIQLKDQANFQKFEERWERLVESHQENRKIIEKFDEAMDDLNKMKTRCKTSRLTYNTSIKLAKKYLDEVKSCNHHLAESHKSHEETRLNLVKEIEEIKEAE